jgi:ribosomal protein L13E
LSSKQTKKKPAAKEVKVKAEAPKRPTGKVPEAFISSRHGTGTVTREARGFSLGELSGAGVPARLASKWGARIDYRRRSVLDSNVVSLRSWGGHLVPAKKHEGRVKRAEEELEKVEKEVEEEVERGVAEVEKEAIKVEREVKKEAVKAEKAVRAKVAKPKAKAKPKPKKKED